MAESPSDLQPSAELIDPVCGSPITPGDAIATAEYQGTTYYFLHIKCKMLFEREPARFLTAGPQPSLAVTAPEAAAAKPPRPARRRRLALVLAGGGAVLVAAILAAVASLDGEEPPDDSVAATVTPAGVPAAPLTTPAAGEAVQSPTTPTRPTAPDAETPPSVVPSQPPATKAAPGTPAPEATAAAKPPKTHAGGGKVATRAGGAPKPTRPTEAEVPPEPKPTTAKAYYELGNTYLADKKLKQAVAAFRTAIKMDDQLVEAYAALGLAYSQQGKDRQAVEMLMIYLKLAPTGTEAARVREMIQEYEAREKTPQP